MRNVQLKCAVVDDSKLQRLLIAKLIRMHPSLVFAGEYKNGVEAHRELLTNKIDLLFLDIEMPLLSGFDFLDKLVNRPLVIFITGKTEYAFKAFDYNAVDYLQKPVEKERFLSATRKAINTYLLKSEDTTGDEDFIFVKSNLKKKKVFLNELRYIQALGDYVKLVTDYESLVVLSTMKAFENQLPENRFLRIHKSYIANLDRVQRYSSKIVELDNNDKLPLSRTKKNVFRQALETHSTSQ